MSQGFTCTEASRGDFLKILRGAFYRILVKSCLGLEFQKTFIIYSCGTYFCVKLKRMKTKNRT